MWLRAERIPSVGRAPGIGGLRSAISSEASASPPEGIRPLPETAHIALGATLGAVVLVAVASLKPLQRAWVLPALVATVLVAAPSNLGAAIDSWGVSTSVAILAITAATVTAAATGTLAAARLGDRAFLMGLAGVAVAVFVGVPDTERATVMAVALCVLLLAHRLVPELPVPAPAAAAGSAGVVLAGLDGATAGVETAVGAWGAVMVLLAATGARRIPDQHLPFVAAAPATLTIAAVVVARLAASEVTTPVLLAWTAGVLAVTTLVMRLLVDRLPAGSPPSDPPGEAGHLTSGREPPQR